MPNPAGIMLDDVSLQVGRLGRLNGEVQTYNFHVRIEVQTCFFLSCNIFSKPLIIAKGQRN